MKKKWIIGILICATVCVSVSCARKINGATPHRRDRNCGCENLSPTPNSAQDSTFKVQGSIHNSLITEHNSLITKHNSQFTVHSSQFTDHSSQFTNH